MDIANIRTFLAAAAAGSFVEAASRVHISPSVVTERIKQLEHELRAKLFDRDKRGCRLTPAGRRFLAPAQNILRAWQLGCEQAALPPLFTGAAWIGGQHALWPSVLIPALSDFRRARPEVAIRATAAAPAQLNRALDDGDLDIAFLYDPLLRRGIRVEPLANDTLVLVTAAPDTPWQNNFARIDWGEKASAEIAARLGDLPSAGLELDLGILSLDWLVETCSSGYVPEQLAAPYLRAGRLYRLDHMPAIEFSPFVCWQTSLDAGLVSDIVGTVKERMGGLLG